MKLDDILTVVTAGAFVLAAAHFTISVQSAGDRDRLLQANQKAQQWMNDTTTRLDGIQAGIEKITGETVELAQQVHALADRLDALEATQ
ncbi:MAG: hypothetical protein ACRCTP_17725 [Aeromonas popoffii]|uniref:hypothetical protein n=1 Tax=Aeromonas popoffii TaxID=70856 RepID=UPI003F3DB8BB